MDICSNPTGSGVNHVAINLTLFLCACYNANILPTYPYATCRLDIISTLADTVFGRVANMSADMLATCQADTHMSVDSTIFRHSKIRHSQLSYSRGNNEEYLTHIVAVLQVIEQKGLPKKCQVLAKAVARRSEALKNLQEATESQDTVLTTVDVTAHKVEIEQTQQMLQEAQKAHDKAIAKPYEQLRNLLFGNAQSQCDRVCRKMHERDSWAAVNS
jgi:hypothetical protein